MKLHFIQRYFGPDVVGTAAAGLNPVGAAIAGVQGALSIIQTISGAAKAKKLLAQRRAYQTPEEIFKILQAAENNAQQGFDPGTLNYLTNQTDRAFSLATGAATRLGGNPNDFSAIFDQKMQSIMRIGSENHALNMANFSKYLSALDTVASNRASEWASQQDILKDKLQAAIGDKLGGVAGLGSAANAFISLDAARRTGSLHKEPVQVLSPNVPLANQTL